MAKRPRGFISGYRPRGANVDLLAAVQSVLTMYQDQLPLTIRQVFYVLVGKYDYEKTEAAYKRLCELLANARRGGVIPFDHIRDDGPSAAAPQLFKSGDDWLTAIHRSANHVRLSPWNLQPRYVEVICEAGGMVPMLASVADPYGITVRSGGGFDSITAKHELAQHYARQQLPVTVLHVGDHDPSGEALWTNLSEDVGAFCQSLGADFSVQRIAVTKEHQQIYSLPTAPPKKTDKRSVWNEGDQTVQAEALPPDILQSIVRDAIEANLDLDQLAETRRLEQQTRDKLSAVLSDLTTNLDN
ncbi:hypothetical protein [Synechococcus sp. PROS-U-1]|uniref:hypothetical protein n=1 Tax=Synechococcus sp. PROS-U-1 TaxID=1400866 RepID=UPI001645D23A|nr:hypothetical protein [Synechococcus sp. PROS-U-1]QNJ03726.1 hypothetical protein SynPROSU1_02130 [Synechococcus sp. PROS-U-1]